MSGFRMRSLLFVPGGKLALLEKVARCSPDAVVLDWEDAVAQGEKDSVLAACVPHLTLNRPDATTFLIRINPVGTPWHDADLAACGELSEIGAIDGVVLPKYEAVEQLAAVHDALTSAARVVVGIESGLGVAESRALLAAAGMTRPDAVYFGAEDYAADIGARRTPHSAEVLYARSRVVLHAALAGVIALDQAVVAVRDTAHFVTDATAGRDLGYAGKICLHPDQVRAAHDIFSPSEAEIAHARAVLAGIGSGVGVVEGAMVDAVHIRMAEALLARAGNTPLLSVSRANPGARSPDTHTEDGGEAP
ncbi:MAG: HpcH/HpaI aldolase/citrate lyase family protein [Sporichthyaceae bacterium]